MQQQYHICNYSLLKIDFYFNLPYNKIMENVEDKTQAQINYDVFNALNLYNEDLGQAYIKNGFNPFGNNFVLDEEFVTDSLCNARAKKEVPCPNFLEQSENDIAKSFDLSLQNATLLLDVLSKKANGAELSENQKKALNKIILALKMYIELISQYKAKLKKEKNKYQLYVNLLSLNWFLSEEMAQSFTQEFNIQNTIAKINLSQQNIAEQENDSLKEQAKKIIENNQKALLEKNEQTHQQDKAEKQEINPYLEALNKLHKESFKQDTQTNPQPKNQSNEHDSGFEK